MIVNPVCKFKTTTQSPLSLTTLSRNHHDNERRSTGLARNNNASRVRTILLFTKFFASEDWWLGDRHGCQMAIARF